MKNIYLEVQTPIPKAASQNPEGDKSVWVERNKGKAQWKLEGSSNEANSEQIKAELFIEAKVLPDPFRAGACTNCCVTSPQAGIYP